MIFGLGDPQFYLYFGFFLIASFISWFVPGWIVVSRVKLKDKLAEMALSLPAGIAFWGIQGYIFGYLQLRLLSYVYIGVFLVLFLRKIPLFLSNLIKAKQIFGLQPKLLNLSILAGSVVQILGHSISGLQKNGAVAFYFLRSHVMHLAYIQSIAEHFPPLEPGASGLPLQNYHYWSDLVLADLVRIWPIPIMHLVFQYAPIILSLSFTLLIVRLVYRLKDSNLVAYLAVFLFSLGADASYIFTLILHGSWGETITTIDSGLAHYFNIPQVFARLIFVAVIFLLLEWWKKKKLEVGLITVLLMATLFGFKVYHGIYAVIGFCAVIAFKGLQEFFTQLKNKNVLKAFIFTLKQIKIELLLTLSLAICSLAVFLPPNKNSGGLFYSPLEWPKLFLGAEQINFNEWWLRMQVYEEAQNYRNIIIFNLIAIAIALLSIFGTRLLGILPTIKTESKLPKELLAFLIPANIIFLLLGLFTMQESGGLNTFNFFIVPIVSFNLFTALNLANLPKKFIVPAVIVFILLTLPRSVFKLAEIIQNYQNQNTTVYISNHEIEALNFIKNSLPETAIVQSHPNNNQDRQTPYVSFFSDRLTYLSGVSMLGSHNQPYEERQELVLTSFEKTNPLPDLNAVGVDYIYLVGEQRVGYQFPDENLVFQNSEVMILSTESEN